MTEGKYKVGMKQQQEMAYVAREDETAVRYPGSMCDLGCT